MDLIKLIKLWCRKNGISTAGIIPDTGMPTLIVNIPDTKVVKELIDQYKDEFADKRVIIKKRRNGTQITMVDKGINDSLSRRKENMNFKDKLEECFGLSEAQIRTGLFPTRRDKRRNKRKGGHGAGLKNESQYKTYVSPTKSLKSQKGRVGDDSKKDTDKRSDDEKPTSIIAMTVKKSPEDDGFIKKTATFKMKLLEALDGIATADNVQPKELVGRFMAALDNAGQKLGMGSIREMLTRQGIKIAQSKDGQALILYSINKQTNAAQPMMRIPIDSLNENSKFEEAIFNCIDYARGDAPGAFKQRQEAMRDQEGAVREIITQIGPDTLKVDNNAQQNAGTQIARNV